MRRLSKITNSRSVGQTLVVMLVAVFLLSLMLLAVTEFGDRARRQWYLQTAADNAAHSGAVMMARQLNLTAVLNRALIGNQIAIAQWLGLASWVTMILNMIDNIALIASLLPPLTAAMLSVRRILMASGRALDVAMKALMVFHSGVIAAISKAQAALDTGMIAETVKTITEVLEDHDASLNWSLFQGGSVVPFPALWWRMTDVRSTRQRRHSQSFKTLTLKSRDGFTQRRTYRWVDVPGIKIVKAGGSALQTPISGRWNWNALDAVEVQIGGGTWTSKIPAGVGAEAQNNKYWSSYDEERYYGGAFRHVKYAAPIAWQKMTRYRVRQLPLTYVGLRSGRRLGRHALVVRLVDKATKQQTYARAEVHFSRPQTIFPRSDRQLERDNLFNALWYPKLVPLSTVDKGRFSVTEAWDG